MKFDDLKNKLAQLKRTGQLDKYIMEKLTHLLPVKQLAYKFLKDAADATHEFESDDAWLNWFNSIMSDFVLREMERPPKPDDIRDGLAPEDRDTARIIIPAKKVGMSMLEADRVYRESMVGLVAMLRAASRPPLDASETEKVERMYKVKVV